MRNHTIIGLHDLHLGDPSSLLNAISAVEATETEATERFAA